MSQEVSVRIDGELCTATEGQTIYEVARANGRYIPALCHMEGLSSAGTCRLCLVEVAGIGRLLPACTTPVHSGMSVTTDSENLAHHRLMALELLFVERNHICAVCVSNGHCELQALAQTLGLTHVRFPYNYPAPAGRHLASPLRARSQPLRPLLPLRPRLRRDRRRPRLGHRRARHQLPVGLRSRSSVGRVRELHQLRQMRPGLPDRRPGGEGPRGRGNDQAE